MKHDIRKKSNEVLILKTKKLIWPFMAIKDARMFVSESQLETKYYIRLAKTNCKKKTKNPQI